MGEGVRLPCVKLCLCLELHLSSSLMYLRLVPRNSRFPPFDTLQLSHKVVGLLFSMKTCDSNCLQRCQDNTLTEVTVLAQCGYLFPHNSSRFTFTTPCLLKLCTIYFEIAVLFKLTCCILNNSKHNVACIFITMLICPYVSIICLKVTTAI